MAVNLSPVGGVAGQFFDNNGDPLVGGKLFTYAAGTTTPQVTFTSASGGTPNSNPIILNAGGRVPSEIWLTDGLVYKFVLYSSTDQLIGSWDNIIGINSNFVNFTTSEEVQIATAGQTVFTLTTMTYQPGTNNLVVYVDGVNQVEGGSYSYVETNSTTVTFTAGLHVGAVVKFVSAEILSTSAGDASQISYTPAGTGAVSTNVQAKLRETVSVKDFGAVGDGVTDDTAAIQAAIDYAATLVVVDNNYPVVTSAVYIPAGRYVIASGSSITIKKGVRLFGASRSSVFIYHGGGGVPCITSDSGAVSNVQIQIERLSITGAGATTTYGILLKDSYRDADIREVTIRDCNVNVYLEDSFTAFIDRCDFQFAVTHQVQILNATAVTIFNCRMDNAGEHGVFLDGDVKGTVHCMFDNNQIQRCQKAGIYALDIDSIYVTNGYFEGNNRSDASWSDVHWVKGTRNRGTNGTIQNCYATATTGGSNCRFATVDIPGIVTFIANRNYDDLSTPDPAYQFGVYLGSSTVKMVSVNNIFSGTTAKIGRAATTTQVYDDGSFDFYLPNSLVRVNEGGSGVLNFNLIGRSGNDVSLVFGNTDDAAQASVNYFASTKRFQFNGYDNSTRLILKEQGQFQFARLAAAPTVDLAGGDVYYDTSLGKLRLYDGTSWVNLN